MAIRPWRAEDGDLLGPELLAVLETDGAGLLPFAVEHRGVVAGRVSVRRAGDGVGELRWGVLPEHRGFGVAVRSLRLLVGYCFDELGLARLEAFVPPEDRPSIRTAGRAGLRKEGVARGRARRHGQRADELVFARVVGDPEPDSRDGFLSVLNAGLPTKRVITQGLLRNGAGDLLMCELTYKGEWDLPGGVVDPRESPAFALVREVAEELRVDVRPLRLAATNWLPPYRAWDDAMLFVYELELLGMAAEELFDHVMLEPREIRQLHWCSLADVDAHAAPYVGRHLRSIAAELERSRQEGRKPATLYLEDGLAPE
ncbi:MAG TPA: NUDIX hydrolase [Segeticoccus sp.]|uniref:NUDIX hydrolase n=1 Tax=Segeticoccus sp. TaxID=2706531 RepID=UPI002D802BFF|nr:NUDIX hydrolase [Segeticoccus sp.]HET8602027.1 NUDIX hydrolase [Segeticoccus sp.]